MLTNLKRVLLGILNWHLKSDLRNIRMQRRTCPAVRRLPRGFMIDFNQFKGARKHWSDMSFDYLRILTIIHFASLGGLLFYGVHRLWLIACWYTEHRKKRRDNPPAQPADFPVVTIQLPFYNERFVAARLIECAARLDWPKDRLEIQVLDDSTDDTAGIVDETANRLALEGARIRVFRRAHRKGYKAGALQEGMEHASGELVARFDADFLPQPEFLVRTPA